MSQNSEVFNSKGLNRNIIWPIYEHFLLVRAPKMDSIISYHVQTLYLNEGMQ